MVTFSNISPKTFYKCEEKDREGSVGQSQDEVLGQRTGEEGKSTNLEESFLCSSNEGDQDDR